MLITACYFLFKHIIYPVVNRFKIYWGSWIQLWLVVKFNENISNEFFAKEVLHTKGYLSDQIVKVSIFKKWS